MFPRHTIEYVKEYINNFNYVCDSMIYKNSITKIDITCPNNHKFKQTFKDFKSGNRCPYCAKNKRKTIEEIKEYSLKYNYICHSNEYINDCTKLEYECCNKHLCKITWNDFKNGYRCRECWLYRISGKNNYRWKEDRTRKIRTEYLAFDLRKINILKEEPLYNNYIISKKEAKLSNKVWDKTEYSVDHIYPRIAFIDNNLDKIYDIKLIKEICNSRDNLRIIHHKENRDKWDKYNQEEFIKWFNNKIDSK